MAYTPTLWAKGDKVTSEKLNKIEQGIVDKVDKETGKTLSTNDFTDAYKTKLDGIDANADKTTIDATLTNSGDAADAKATGDAIKEIENDLDGKVAIIESDLDEKVENLKSLVGTPLKATTASDMTDTSKIYIYTGNESGYTNGDWYYHDGSAWVDGGTYNSIAVVVDDTLTVSGMPADAKVVGDEISIIKEELSAVEDRVKSLDDISDAYVNLSPPEESTEAGWRYGIVDTAGSIVSLNTKRLVTANTVDDAVVVLIEDGYEAIVHAWDGSTYVGRYTTDNTFEKQVGTGKWFTSKIDLSKYIYKIFRLVIRKSDDTVFADPSEASTIIKFAQVKYIKDVVESCEQTSAEVAELVEEKDNATNSYVSSSIDPPELEWRYGNINTTGQHDSPTNTRRLTILDFIPTSTRAVGLSDGIISFLYAYDINTEAYLGRYTTDNEFSPSEGTAQQFTGQIDLSVFSGKFFRIVLKKSDNSAFASQDGSNLITLENKIYIKDLAEKVEAIEKSRGINRYSYVGSPEIYIPTDTTDSVIDSMQASEIYTMYDNLVTNYPKWISRASDIGVDSDNNPIRHYIIRLGNACYNNASYPNVSTNNWMSNFDNKHVLINAGTHGDEKTSVLGVARFAELLLASTDKWAMFIKTNFVLHIIPILNVWGFNNMSRENKDGINVNRDYADFATTEAQSIRDLCEQLGDNLKAIIDSHNTQSDIGMMGTKPTYTNYLYYIRTAICLASVLTPYLSNHYNADKFPYFYAWESSSGDTLMDFTNINGYIGGTIETPRNYNSGVVNHAETSAMVVGLLANLIPTYGTKDT